MERLSEDKLLVTSHVALGIAVLLQGAVAVAQASGSSVPGLAWATIALALFSLVAMGVAHFTGRPNAGLGRPQPTTSATLLVASVALIASALVRLGVTASN